MDTKNEFLQHFDEQPFHKYLGMTIEETSTDFARLRLKKTQTTPSGIGGSVNGGVIATLVDMAALPAVFSNMKEGSEAGGTADLQVTFLRQAHGEWIDAEATVIKRGRNLCTIEVNVVNNEGLLCAKARVLYALRSSV